MLQLQIEKVRAFLIAVCALALVHTASAGPASPQPIQAAQPNGATFQAFMRGDEFQGWMETADGFTVLKNPATGFFEFADQDAAGQLVPSGIAVVSAIRPPNAQTGAVSPKGLRPVRNAALTQYQGKFLDTVLASRLQSGANGRPALSGAWTPAPVSGAKKVLTILVSFQDAKVSSGAAAHWGHAVYSPTGTSVNKYFQDNSFGAVSITPVTHTQQGSPAGVVSVSLAQSHPNCGSNCSYPSEAAWVNNALASASAHVNFAALDSNGDGSIGTDEALIYFVVAGYEASANAALAPNVWAHAWGGNGVAVAGKSVNHWALNGEMYDAVNRMGIGAMAHEFGHLGGLPDLYDNSATNAGLGGFSLMASGSWGRRAGETAGTTPVALDALSRQYLGWSTPQSPADGATVSLVSGLASPSSAVLLMNSALSSSEYWLVENRPPVGWDAGLQDFLGTWTGGLLIQHIDLNAGLAALRNFNTYVWSGHQGAMAVEPASAACSLASPYTTSRGCASLLFHASNGPVFNGGTIPGSNYYDGVVSGLGLSNISAPDNVMSATVKRVFGNNPPAAVPTAVTGDSRSRRGGGTPSALSGKVTASDVVGSVNVALASAGGVASASSTLTGYPVTRV
ncbi:MAG: M6 family metalloprotease domain-containing protein, partial [Pseudomonadota bacterium]